MAILAVRIEDEGTLRFNEFFDYNGKCYALSKSRASSCATGIVLEDFYECTVLTDWIEDIPVIFLWEDPSNKKMKICGWYRKAKIWRKVMQPCLFLEGNICARSLDAVMLTAASRPEAVRPLPERTVDFGDKMYRVIENDEDGYEQLEAIMEKAWPQETIRYDLVPSAMDKGAIRREAAALMGACGGDSRKARYEVCIRQCMAYGQMLMDDACKDIGDIKTLRDYGKMAVTLRSGQADGYYYEALADEHLGFVKEGLKAVNKALNIEPDGADILALKANLLADMGDYSQAASLYSESFDISADEAYLLMKGRVLFIMGNVDGAYEVYRRITDKELLEAAGINLNDMERRWPFVAIRGLKNLLKKGSKEG